MASRITPPLRLLIDIPAWQSEVLQMPAPAIACGALLLLKMHLWRIGPIPDDDVALARITATSPREWKKVRKAVEPLFIVKYGEWQRHDWNDELEASYEAVNKASRAGKKANEIRWGRKKQASESDSESDRNRTPNPILNIKAHTAPTEHQTTQPKPAQPWKANLHPAFGLDVDIAEAALRIGGAA